MYSSWSWIYLDRLLAAIVPRAMISRVALCMDCHGKGEALLQLPLKLLQGRIVILAVGRQALEVVNVRNG